MVNNPHLYPIVRFLFISFLLVNISLYQDSTTQKKGSAREKKIIVYCGGLYIFILESDSDFI